MGELYVTYMTETYMYIVGKAIRSEPISSKPD